MHFSIPTVAALSAVASAYELPDNLRSLYQAHIVRLSYSFHPHAHLLTSRPVWRVPERPL